VYLPFHFHILIFYASGNMHMDNVNVNCYCAPSSSLSLNSLLLLLTICVMHTDSTGLRAQHHTLFPDSFHKAYWSVSTANGHAYKSWKFAKCGLKSFNIREAYCCNFPMWFGYRVQTLQRKSIMSLHCAKTISCAKHKHAM
jgi:hypothetical protein